MLVFDFVRLAKAAVPILLFWSPSLCLLGIDRDVVARCRREAEVLIFDLADVAKALA